MPGVKLILGDCLSVLPTLADGSVDAIVTDPPAGISFMGKGWDSFGGRCNPNAERDRAAANRGPGAGLGNQPFGYCGSSLPKSRKEREAFVEFLSAAMAEALRCLKPGGYALVWALPRTSHWTAMALEDAGFEIRDRLAHIFGQGFPKSKACLKPAVEDWWLARKPGPLVPLGIDQCRTPIVDLGSDGRSRPGSGMVGSGGVYDGGFSGDYDGSVNPHPDSPRHNAAGRWPTNLVMCHHPDCRPCGVKRVKGDSRPGGEGSRPGGFANIGSTNGNGKPVGRLYGGPDGLEAVEAWVCVDGCPVAELDRQGHERGMHSAGFAQGPQEKWAYDLDEQVTYGSGKIKAAGARKGDSGGPSRFFPTFSWAADDPAGLPIESLEHNYFYCSKASRRERNAGLEGMPEGPGPVMNDRCRNCGKGRLDGRRGGPCCDHPDYEHVSPKGGVANHHPCVKPLALCQWLAKLICPPNGVILDPFMGSGSIGVAAIREGFHYIGIEMDPGYHEIAERRLAAARADLPLFAGPGA